MLLLLLLLFPQCLRVVGFAPPDVIYLNDVSTRFPPHAQANTFSAAEHTAKLLCADTSSPADYYTCVHVCVTSLFSHVPKKWGLPDELTDIE